MQPASAVALELWRACLLSLGSSGTQDPSTGAWLQADTHVKAPPGFYLLTRGGKLTFYPCAHSPALIALEKGAQVQANNPLLGGAFKPQALAAAWSLSHPPGPAPTPAAQRCSPGSPPPGGRERAWLAIHDRFTRAISEAGPEEARKVQEGTLIQVSANPAFQPRPKPGSPLPPPPGGAPPQITPILEDEVLKALTRKKALLEGCQKAFSAASPSLSREDRKLGARLAQKLAAHAQARREVEKSIRSRGASPLPKK